SRYCPYATVLRSAVYALYGDGAVTSVPGGIEQYLARRRDAAAERKPAQQESAKPASRAAEQRAARKELARLERKLDSLHDKEQKLHAALAEAATDPDRLLELDMELKNVLAEKESVEQRWMELADTVE